LTVAGLYAAYTLLKYNDPLYGFFDLIIHSMSSGHFLGACGV